VTAVLLGLLIRYALAPFTAWPHDVVVWFQAAIAGQHSMDLYARAGFPYPPVWGTLLQGLGQAMQAMGIHQGQLSVVDSSYRLFNDFTQSYSETITLPAFNLAFKTVLFAFDLGCGLLILRLVTILGIEARRRPIAFAVWFLNPFVIFESAVFGGFDVMVAFFCLAAIVALLEERWVWAGMAVAFGIATKVSPVFLLPLMGLFVLGAHRQRGSRPTGIRSAVLFACGLVAGIAIALGPQIALDTWRAVLHGTFSRADLVVGGFSIFGIRELSLFAWLPRWAAEHAGVIVQTSTGLTALASLAGCWVGLRLARRNAGYGLVAGVVLALSGILLVQPLTQPQYLIWMLPEVLALAVVTGRARWQAVAFSITPIVFVYGLLGPLALVGPLSEATSLVSPSFIVDHSLAWYTASTHLWGVDFGGNYNAIASVVTVMGLLALVVSLVRHDAPLPGSGFEPWPQRWPRLAATAAAFASRDKMRPTQGPGRLAFRFEGTTIVEAAEYREGKLFQSWQALRHEGTKPTAKAFEPKRRRPGNLLVLAAVGVPALLLLVSESAAYRPAPFSVSPGSVSVATAEYKSSGPSLDLRVRPGPAQEAMRLVAFPVLAPPARSNVLVFVDPRYPGPDSSSRGVQGVYDHLSAELRVRGDSRSVVAADLDGLQAILADRANAAERIIVMMTGSWPASVYSRSVDQVTPWVRAGGTLIWGGDAIGYYSVHASTIFDPSDDASRRDPGPPAFLGSDIVELGKQTGRNATQATTFAQALDLQFSSTAVGVRTKKLEAAGGRALGYTAGGYSSISELPVGQGRILMFSGDTYNEVPLAHDIAILLLTGALETAGDVNFRQLGSQDLSKSSEVRWEYPSYGQRGSMILVGFDPSPEGVFFSRELVSPSG
jgi:hypothetical protein